MADLERYRSSFFLIGLIAAMSFVLAAFGMSSKAEEAQIFDHVNWDTAEEVLIPITRPEKKQPVPPPLSIKEIVLDIPEGMEEFDESTLSTEASVGDIIPVSPILGAGTPEADVQEVYDLVQQMPEFPGGMRALLAYVSRNVKYPVLAQENGIGGKVYVRFVVNTDGSIADAHVLRSVDTSLDREALRVVNSMPQWRPGMQNGRLVRVNFTIPINFVLQ